MYVQNKIELIRRLKDLNQNGQSIDIRDHINSQNYGWASQTIRDWCEVHQKTLVLNGPYVYEVLGIIKMNLKRRRPVVSKRTRHVILSRDTMMCTIANTVRDLALEDYGASLDEIREDGALITTEWLEVPEVGKGIWMRLVPK